MNLKCMLGSHSWNGCRCAMCGKSRDVGHDWTNDCQKCAICGLTRTQPHDWRKDCEHCSCCRAIREGAHDWIGCKCRACGQTLRQKYSDVIYQLMHEMVRVDRRIALDKMGDAAIPIIAALLQSDDKDERSEGELIIGPNSRQVSFAVAKRARAMAEVVEDGPVPTANPTNSIQCAPDPATMLPKPTGPEAQDEMEGLIVSIIQQLKGKSNLVSVLTSPHWGWTQLPALLPHIQKDTARRAMNFAITKIARSASSAGSRLSESELRILLCDPATTWEKDFGSPSSVIRIDFRIGAGEWRPTVGVGCLSTEGPYVVWDWN